MNIKGWKYYNHAAIPTGAPHEDIDISPIENGSIWNIEGYPLLARWTSNFDCDYETGFWYVIKDVPFDISELKAKRRYEINKGNRNFDVVEINPIVYKQELYEVTVAAYQSWPAKYRPKVEKDTFIGNISEWNAYKVYGAFYKENNQFCGYVLLFKEGKYINFSVQRTIPGYEKLAVNAALVYKILIDHDKFLSKGGYICDGARSINHETAFQDYLEKYFGFRKAYCRLQIAYNPKIKWLIKVAYPIRKIFKIIDKLQIIHLLNSILRIEEIVRQER
jgi:hypothetical protein